MGQTGDMPTSFSRSRLPAAALLLLLVACDTDSHLGPQMDSGRSPTRDAAPAPRDASTPTDAFREEPDASDAAPPPPSCADGPPTPVAVEGPVAHGQELVIRGGCFGERALGRPLLWDDAESAYADVIDGAPVPVGEEYPFLTNVDARVRFATAASRSQRGRSAAHYAGYGANHRQNYLGGHDYDPDGRGGAHREMYVSWYVRLDTPSADAASAKLIRFWAGDHNGRTYRMSWTTMHLTYDYIEDVATESDRWAVVNHTLTPISWDTWDGEDALGEWHRLELYFRQSTSPEATDGRILLTTDGRIEHDLRLATWLPERPQASDEIREGPRFGDDPPNRLGLIGLDPSVSIGDYVVELDDVYVDSTRARVEVCDVARWSARAGALCEIQPEASWSAERISVRANLGAHSGGEAWLYVVAPEGRVNEDGLPVYWEEAD